MTTTSIAQKVNPVKELQSSRASRGIKPGVYADKDAIMSSFEEEAAEADLLLKKMAEIRPGRPSNAYSGNRVHLVVTTMKLPEGMVAELKSVASESGKGYGQTVRELLWSALRAIRSKGA